MNVVDSSGWIEHFTAGPNADFFAEPIQDANLLVVPAITIYEVAKGILRLGDNDPSTMLRAVALMRQGRVIDVDCDLALKAAAVSIEHQLPIADSLILATARASKATLWTQDSDLKDLDGVNYVAKGARKARQNNH